MTTKQALEIKKAIMLLSDFTEMIPTELVGNICFLNKERNKKFVEASDIWNQFENETDIVKRGKMLGVEVSVTN